MPEIKDAGPEGPAHETPSPPSKATHRVSSTVHAGARNDITPGQAPAVTAADRGWHVFPCLVRDKRPAIPDHSGNPGAPCDHCHGPHRGWEQRASADPGHITAAWSARWRQHNVGIACGPSRLVVIDLDTHEPLPDSWRQPGVVDGRDVFAAICDYAGQPWPSTYTVTTPAGGWHLYYAAPAGCRITSRAGVPGPSIDIRAAGGFVVAAGSVVDERAYPGKPHLAALTAGGRPYTVLDPGPVAPLPGWLRWLLTPQTAAPAPAPRPAGPVPPGRTAARIAGLVHTVETAPDGTLNNTLHWAACRAGDMTAAGETDPETITAALLSAAAAAGHPERGALRTIASGMRKGTAA